MAIVFTAAPAQRLLEAFRTAPARESGQGGAGLRDPCAFHQSGLQ